MSGGYSGVTVNLPFLTPSLSYPTDEVVLTLSRNLVSFPDVATNADQRASAGTIETLGPSNSLYDAVVGLSTPQAQAAFQAASGEIHASAVAGAFEDSRLPREAILDRLSNPDDLSSAPAAGGGFTTSAGSGHGMMWGRSLGSIGHFETDGDAATLRRSLAGFVGGMDLSLFDNMRIGVATAYTESNLSLSGSSSSGTVQTAFGGLYGGASFGGLQLRAGALVATQSFMMDRTVGFMNFADTDRATYDGNLNQAFGEIGWRYAFAKSFVEPFAGVLAMRLDMNGFTESGGAAVLTGQPQDYNEQASSLGVRFESSPFGDQPATLRGLLAWRHAFGVLAPATTLAFLSSPSNSFMVQGVSLARNMVAAELGLDWQVTRQATIGVFYSGQYAVRAQDNAIEGKFELKF